MISHSQKVEFAFSHKPFGDSLKDRPFKKVQKHSIIFVLIFFLFFLISVSEALAGAVLHFNVGPLYTAKKLLPISSSVNFSNSIGGMRSFSFYKELNSAFIFNPGVPFEVFPVVPSSGASILLEASKVEGEFIVQFSRPITESDLLQLQKSTSKIFGYFPDDALVVRGFQLSLEEFAQAFPDRVQAIVQYDPIYKVHSALLQELFLNGSQLLPLTVSLFDSMENEKISGQIQALSPQVFLQESQGKYLKFLAPRGIIAKIATLAGVEHVQLTPTFELSDSDTENGTSDDYAHMTGYEDGTKIMKFEAAWNQGFAGQNQILGMADMGVDSGDLNSLVLDLKGSIIEGEIFGTGSNSWADPMGHGTHIAGLMVGRGVQSQGRIHGGAFGAQLLVSSLWSPDLKTLTFPAQISRLFEGAYARGARVHSNSWGSNKDLGAYTDSAAQIDEWVFHHPDMLLVFSAGNNGGDYNKDGRIDGMSLGTPGTAKNCLTVGASKNRILQGGIQGPLRKLKGGADLWPMMPLSACSMSDTETGLAPFSSRGPTKDGRIKPDVVAPGTNILGVKSHQDGASSLWGYFNSDYTWAGGTSMSTPLVAAAASVTRQILIEKWGLKNPSAALVKAVLIHSAEDLFPGQFGEVGLAQGQEILSRRPNFDEGYGRVNIENLVNLGDGTTLIDNHRGIKQNQVVTYQIQITHVSNIAIHLVWTDAAGSPNAELSLVNDLDLELVLPGWQVYSPADHVNNVESLEVANLQPGIYQLKVKGFRVPPIYSGSQAFALVFTVRK